MKRKIEKIREAIHNDFKMVKSDKWKQVSLKEDNTASCKSVFLNEKGVKSVIIELDKQGKDIHPLFTTDRGTAGLKIKNDYLIFALKENKLFALLIELKSKNSEGWIKQCKAGEVVAKYILGMVNNWTDDTKIYVNNFKFRYILFHTNKNTDFKNKKKKKTKMSSVEYLEKNGLLYVKKPCNKEYDIGMFCK